MPKVFLGFQKWTKINVQNQKQNFQFGKNIQKSKNILIFIKNMVDIYDLFHYLIGLLIVSFILWVIVKVHNYYSVDKVDAFRLD